MKYVLHAVLITTAVLLAASGCAPGPSMADAYKQQQQQAAAQNAQGCARQISSFEQTYCNKPEGEYTPEYIGMIKQQHGNLERQCTDEQSQEDLKTLEKTCIVAYEDQQVASIDPLEGLSESDYGVKTRYPDNDEPRTVTLNNDVEVQGESFPAGTELGFDKSGYIYTANLGGEGTYSDVTFAAGTVLSFNHDKSLRTAQIHKDHEVWDYRCRARKDDPTFIVFDHESEKTIKRDGFTKGGDFYEERRCF